MARRILVSIWSFGALGRAILAEGRPDRRRSSLPGGMSGDPIPRWPPAITSPVSEGYTADNPPWTHRKFAVADFRCTAYLR